MSFFKHSLVAAIVIVGTSAWAGCGTAEDDGDSGSSDISIGNCSVSSASETFDSAKQNDPIVKRVFGGGCPQQLSGILDSLNKASDCKSSKLTTRVVSDRSLLLDAPDSYRGVLSQDCQGQSDHELFVSIFGINPGAANLPQDGIEVIGKGTIEVEKGKTDGVFNFYVNEGGWKFMGSSADAIADGYDCGKNGDCEPKAAKKARCWACHESGGINMKELNSPWHSWSNTNIHSDAVFKKFKALGQEQDGINMEVRTENANSEWTKTRVKLLKKQGLSEVLRPLMCTLTMNLQATGSSSVSSIPAEFFVEATSGVEVSFPDQSFSLFDSVNFDAKVYNDAIGTKGSNQRVVDRNNATLKNKGKDVLGSPSGFIFPKKGDVDKRYIAELVTQKIIDKDFVQDVLSIDMTRPIFSPSRCALADDLKDVKLSENDMTADKIRVAVKDALGKKPSTAGAALIKAMADTKDGAAHEKAATDFIGECNKRPKDEMVKDILQYNAHLRTAIKAHRASTPDGQQGIIEFSETIPTDNLGDTSKAFDPGTCKLTLP